MMQNYLDLYFFGTYISYYLPVDLFVMSVFGLSECLETPSTRRILIGKVETSRTYGPPVRLILNRALSRKLNFTLS